MASTRLWPVSSLARLERPRAGEQLVEQHAETVDIGARVDVLAGEAELLGAHVGGRADELADAGGERLVR